jgi:hypothetical protein
MSQEARRRVTQTVDFLPGVETIEVKFGYPVVAPPITIYLRHAAQPLWCAAGGKWHAERERAIRFSSNIDALIYCQAVRLNGVVVGIDGHENEVYQLQIDRLLDLVCGDGWSLANLKSW